MNDVCQRFFFFKFLIDGCDQKQQTTAFLISWAQDYIIEPFGESLGPLSSLLLIY